MPGSLLFCFFTVTFNRVYIVCCTIEQELAVVGKSQIVKGRLGGCTILVQLHILCSARSHNHDFPHNEGHNYTKVAQRASNGAFEDQKQSMVNSKRNILRHQMIDTAKPNAMGYNHKWDNHVQQ